MRDHSGRSLFERLSLRRQDIGLVGIFILQIACVGFLVVEGVADIFEVEHEQAETLETPFVIALILGLGVTSLELKRILDRQRRMNAQLKVASGAFSDLLHEHFTKWGLTPSESDVAIMAIKGLSIADIARLRETKEGTIKAQCNAIYRKAGVTGRLQLLSFFIEELMSESLLGMRHARDGAGAKADVG